MDLNSDRSVQISRSAWVLMLLSLVLLAAGLRFYRLDKLPLWNDESIQLSGISMPYEQLVSQHIKGIDHMPPYSYSIQRAFWLRSKTIYAAKVPGAFAGAAMVVLSFLAFRRSESPLLGLLAAFFTATSLYLVYYSQELRCYIFFGFGLWIFLGTFLGILLTPVDEKVSVFRWVFLVIGAVLAGSFHYAAQLLLPAVGVCGVLALFIQYYTSNARENLKQYGFRILWMFLALSLALLISYLEMKHFMGGKLQGMMSEVKAHPLPPASLMYDVFLRFTWGNGWRMACWILVVAAGAVFARKKERIVMLFAGSLCLLSFLLCFYVYPKFGQRPASLASVRYMFWIAWCVMVLLACAVHALWMRFPTMKTRMLGSSVLAVVYLACTVPAFGHYYRMDAKRMNLATAKAAVEAIGGERMLLLGNTYDMHHLASSWPTNCAHAALPVYESDADFERFGFGRLMTQLARTYPNIIIKRSSFERDTAMEAFDQVKIILSEHLRIENDAHAEQLFDIGLNPMVGKPMEYAYLSDDSILKAATEEKQTLLLYPGSMPMILTRDGKGTFIPWRLLQKQQEFEVLHGGNAQILHVTLSVARVGSGALKVEYGNTSKMVSVQPSLHQIFSPDQKKWIQMEMGLQQLASIGYRFPMRLALQQVEFDLPVVHGRNRFRVTPFNHPMLIAPPPVEYTLQKELP